ncbi:hypothetical protein LCGC14_1193460 [marine sediment metagenome]|uniref:Uncharacterized protein n=1 Tax=marine sediment metagenome TaxID=412755 RepID=A0A0F9PP08_9ZZZZ
MLNDEEDKAIRDGNRDLGMRAGARDAAWQDVVAAVDAVAVADREADSQAYRCGVLVRLGAPRSLAARFMGQLTRMMSSFIDYGDLPPFGKAMADMMARMTLHPTRLTFTSSGGMNLPVLDWPKVQFPVSTIPARGIDYGPTPLGRRMTRDSELYLGAARGMPTSDARNGLEEWGALWEPRTCLDCGHTGVDVGLRYCINSFACRERETAAKACLEPVTQA